MANQSNFYLIVFNPAIVNTVALHKFIKESPLFLQWWHYINSVYIVKTKSNLASVDAEITRSWPNNQYLIIKLEPDYRNGLLPPDAWKWFKENVD